MLEICIPTQHSVWNETKEIFQEIPAVNLCLEHSLVSISKWEAKWCKPFISKEDKTKEEMFDYIRCMNMTQNVDPSIFSALPSDAYKTIIDYINETYTATTFYETINQGQQATQSSTKITSELIYYWMISFQIPFECQKWHLNRLLTLIKICNINANHENNKMSQKDILARNQKLNAERRLKYHSAG